MPIEESGPVVTEQLAVTMVDCTPPVDVVVPATTVTAESTPTDAARDANIEQVGADPPPPRG